MSKIKQVRFLCGVLFSQMLSYSSTCLYFTVNPDQTTLWDSGFLITVYSYRRSFCQRNIQSRIFANSPRQSLGRYAGFTTIASIDGADNVMILISRMMM